MEGMAFPDSENTLPDSRRPVHLYGLARFMCFIKLAYEHFY
ncbi:MAG: hypothetical protein JWM16_258 [Verrucomicrobiales bacterium]|nr:hypothetical protein [Verrucomicrobiales bacterium]